MVKAGFKVIPARQMMDNVVEQPIPLRHPSCGTCEGWSYPWSKYRREWRLSDNCEAKFAAQYDWHAGNDFAAVTDLQRLPGAPGDSIEPPRLLKNAVRGHRPINFESPWAQEPRRKVAPLRPAANPLSFTTRLGSIPFGPIRANKTRGVWGRQHATNCSSPSHWVACCHEMTGSQSRLSRKT